MVQDFINRLETKETRVGVVGLGYVGLPLLIEFSKAGFYVRGFDVDINKIEQLNEGTWLDNILAADIYISPAGQNLRIDGQIDPTFIADIQQKEGVKQVNLLQATTVFGENYQPIEIRAVTPQPDETRRQNTWLWAAGSPDDVFAALDQGAVMISEVFARRFDLPLDAPSEITLMAENGAKSFNVVAIFYDYALPELGYVLMRMQTYRTYWPDDDEITNVSLFLEPEAIPRADLITQELTDEFAARYRLSLSSNRAIKENALVVFDRTFTITAALRLLATVVAFIGVLSTLMSLQLERTRELGTLRANGMSLPSFGVKPCWNRA
ncbi:ABC transporter permease [Reichenbachiella sp.]|uniref:ABC transporter permease n=1 Tax=Reichenbachiella sp. TaxID=2184521 RepID=UPI003B5C7C9A